MKKWLVYTIINFNQRNAFSCSIFCLVLEIFNFQILHVNYCCLVRMSFADILEVNLTKKEAKSQKNVLKNGQHSLRPQTGSPRQVAGPEAKSYLCLEYFYLKILE